MLTLNSLDTDTQRNRKLKAETSNYKFESSPRTITEMTTTETTENDDIIFGINDDISTTVNPFVDFLFPGDLYNSTSINLTEGGASVTPEVHNNLSRDSSTMKSDTHRKTTAIVNASTVPTMAQDFLFPPLTLPTMAPGGASVTPEVDHNLTLPTMVSNHSNSALHETGTR